MLNSVNDLKTWCSVFHACELIKSYWDGNNNVFALQSWSPLGAETRKGTEANSTGLWLWDAEGAPAKNTLRPTLSREAGSAALILIFYLHLESFN